MAQFNSLLAALAATGLALAQPTAAAAQSDGGGLLADSPGAGPVVGLLAMVGVVFLIMAVSDGDDANDDFPTSP